MHRLRALWPRMAALGAMQHLPTQCGSGKTRDPADEAERQRQLSEAAQWASENGCRGSKAAKQKVDDGKLRWPLASEGSVNRRLDEPRLMDNLFEKHQAVCTRDEEDVAALCRGGTHSREQIAELILAALKRRAFQSSVNADVAPLSKNGKEMMRTEHISPTFFTRQGGWYARHPETRPGSFPHLSLTLTLDGIDVKASISCAPCATYPLALLTLPAPLTSHDQPVESVAAVAQQTDQPPVSQGMHLRKRAAVEAQPQGQGSAKVMRADAPPLLKPRLYSDMARENASLLAQDRRWSGAGVSQLVGLQQDASKLYNYLKDPASWTRTGQLIVGSKSAGGYSNWDDTDATFFDKNEQKAHTVAFTKAMRQHARKIEPLAEILDKVAAQVAIIHGSPCEWLLGHVLDQTSPAARFPPHQDTNEMYSATGKHICDVYYTVLLQLDPGGETAMEILGCDEPAVYAGCGSGFVFRSSLWHRTLYAVPGVWKLALFYGKYV